MPLKFTTARDLLNEFDFHKLFVQQLGWSNPPSPKPVAMSVQGVEVIRRQIADLCGVGVYEIKSDVIPAAKIRAAVHREIAKIQYECLLIFIDSNGAQSLWHWAKRQDGKSVAREHLFTKGQPGDLFISKISAMVFELSEFDSDGRVALMEVSDRIKAALDVQRVTKRFFTEFQSIHDNLVDLISGIADDNDRRWYASILLNRLMFIYFLQRKGFLDYKNKNSRDGNVLYLQEKLADSQRAGPNQFYRRFLHMLFFEGFAKPEEKRTAEARRALGNIRYLNGGLFLPHRIETENKNITIPDEFFERLLKLFSDYSWNLNDTPGENDREISPHVLGYIFEKYINQKAFGAYYTRPEITEYLCERTIHQLILDSVTCLTNLISINYLCNSWAGPIRR